MLSPDQLADLGYVDSLDMRTMNIRDKNLTTVYMKFEINESARKSEVKMDELNEVIRDICNVGNNRNNEDDSDIIGLLNLEMGVDDKEGIVHHSSIYSNSLALDSIFVKMFDNFVKLMCYATMTESICSTSPSDVNQCKMSLSRFYVPEKFIVLPNLIEQDCSKFVTKNDLEERESIRFVGNMKITKKIVDDDSKWNAFVKSLEAYNSNLLQLEGAIFIENAIDRESATMFYAEHYINREAVVKKASWLTTQMKTLIADYLEPSEMNIFCSANNKEFCKMVIQKYNPNKSSILEYSV